MSEAATINYHREIRGALVTNREWLELSADQLREAIAHGDLLVIKQTSGTYMAISASEFGDHVVHCEDYFRPGWSDGVFT
jgi:hypothetical protein